MSEETLTRIKWERDTTQAPAIYPEFRAMLWAIVAGGVAFLAVGIQDETGRAWAIHFGGMVAGFAFLIAFPFFLWLQLRQGVRETTIETPVSPAGESYRVMVADIMNKHTIRTAGYDMDDFQHRLLAQRLSSHGWKFTRDVVRRAGALPDSAIKDDWATVVRRFQDAGLVDDSQRMTAEGRAYFEKYLPAPRQFRPSTVPPPFRRPEVERGDDDEARWGGGSDE